MHTTTITSVLAPPAPPSTSVQDFSCVTWNKLRIIWNGTRHIVGSGVRAILKESATIIVATLALSILFPASSVAIAIIGGVCYVVCHYLPSAQQIKEAAIDLKERAIKTFKEGREVLKKHPYMGTIVLIASVVLFLKYPKSLYIAGAALLSYVYA